MKHYLTIVLLVFTTAAFSHADTGAIEKRSELFFNKLNNKRLIKSGTPYLLSLLSEDTEEGKAFRNAYINAGRPSRDLFADSQEGHFRVHYDTTGVDAPDLNDFDMNGVPDFVDSALVYLEYAWDKIIALGYGTPKSDKTRGGSSAVDCYIEDLSNQQMYGYTSYDNSNGIAGMYSSYVVIDNNFTDVIYQTVGYDALRMTTAHEFFHVIHISYFGGDNANWWMEQTAVWFENYVWDNINDYLNYIYAIFEDREKPIDTYNYSFEYGATLFAFHIAEKYGIDTIRRIWNVFKDKQSGTIENLDSVLPNGLAQTLSDFAVWMYFTGYRANTEDFFSEADIIRDTVSPEKLVVTVPAVDTLRFRQYTFKYVEIIPEKGFAVRDTLHCNFTNPDGGTWKNQVILYNSPKDYAVEPLNWQQPSIPIERPFERAIVVMTNTSERPSHKDFYSYIYEIDIDSRIHVDENPIPLPFALHQNYPNPFNPATTITYTIPTETPVLLRVMNIQGQVIQTLKDGTIETGTHSLVFDGSNLPSGMYFLQLTAGDISLARKMTLLK